MRLAKCPPRSSARPYATSTPFHVEQSAMSLEQRLKAVVIGMAQMPVRLLRVRGLVDHDRNNPEGHRFDAGDQVVVECLCGALILKSPERTSPVDDVLAM